ncbi:MAG: IS4 family transposase [Bacteroidota bacterium]
MEDFSAYVSNFVSDEELEKVAIQTGFKQRSSKITPKAFLNTLFFTNAQSCPTLNNYRLDLSIQSSIEVSKQAIDKRFNEKTKSMLTHLLEQVMSSQIKRKLPLPKSPFPAIRIMDSSDFRVSKKLKDDFPGYGGKGREAIAQIQFEYELLKGKVTELSLGSATRSDAKFGMQNIEHIPAHTLLIRDLGYSSPVAFEQLAAHDLYFISRAKAQWSMYEKGEEGLKKLTIEDIKSRLRQQSDKYLDMNILVGSQTLAPVRLIANFLTEKQTQQRIKKKKANSGPLSKLMLESAGLNLFVTNVERQKCEASQIYALYRLRWEVELIFKNWKSILNLHKIHPMNAIRTECVMLIKFIWVMLNWSILRLTEEVLNTELSLHKMTRTFTNRSILLDLSTMSDKGKFHSWLIRMFTLSDTHHQKEYKKGTKKKPLVVKDNSQSQLSCNIKKGHQTMAKKMENKT